MGDFFSSPKFLSDPRLELVFSNLAMCLMMMVKNFVLWLDLDNQASCRDVVPTPRSLDSLGADKNRGNADLNA